MDLVAPLGPMYQRARSQETVAMAAGLATLR